MRNKLIAALLITAILGSMFCVNISANSDNPYKKELSVLEAYNIAITSNDGYVTNEDIAYTLLELLGIHKRGNFREAETILRNLKVVSEDMRFLPGTVVTLNEAYLMALNVLGYRSLTVFGETNRLIRQLNLDSGIETCNKLDEGRFARLAYNMLLTQCNEMVGIKEDAGVYKTGKTLLENYHNGIYLRTAVVAAPYGAIYGYEQFMKDEEVYAGGYRFEIGDTDIAKYLGAKLEIFGVRTNEEINVYQIKSFFVADEKQTTKVLCEDVVRANGFDADDSAAAKLQPQITYGDEKGRIRELRLSENCAIIYNQNTATTISNSDFLGDRGAINFTDSDADGVYDVVFIEKYTSGRVAAADIINKKLTLEGPVEFDFSQTERLIVKDGGRIADFEAVGEGAIVGIYTALPGEEKKVAEIRIFADTFFGVIKTIKSGDRVINVEDKEYEYLSHITDLEAGKGYSFVLDDNKKIIYAKQTSDDGSTYAYFIAYHKEDKAFDNSISIKLLDLNSKYQIYNVKDKIRYTGPDEGGTFITNTRIKVDRLGNILAANFDKRQLIKVLIKDGKLVSITCPKNMQSEPDYKGYDEDTFTLEEVLSDKDSEKVRTGRSLSDNYRAMSSTTMVILDNLSEDDDIEIVRYSIGNTPVVTETSYCMSNGYIYDADESLIASVFVLQYDPVVNNNMVMNANILTSGSRMVVDEVFTALNRDGDITYGVNGYMSEGKRAEYIATDTNVTQKFSTAWFEKNTYTVGQLNRGDVIIPVVGNDGYMKAFYLLLKFDKSSESNTSQYICFNNSSVNRHIGMNTVFGLVKRNYDNDIITFEGENIDKTRFLLTGTFYVYDLKSDMIYKTDAGEYINDSLSINQDKVFMVRNSQLATITVIYRK